MGDADPKHECRDVDTPADRVDQSRHTDAENDLHHPGEDAKPEHSQHAHEKQGVAFAPAGQQSKDRLIDLSVGGNRGMRFGAEFLRFGAEFFSHSSLPPPPELLSSSM